MLGKNNFKERLRKMENQDKHDRFSIRKLSIGAASVLIGFAFMTGIGSHTTLADELNPNDQQPSGVVEPSNGDQGASGTDSSQNAGQANGQEANHNQEGAGTQGQQGSQAPADQHAGSTQHDTGSQNGQQNEGQSADHAQHNTGEGQNGTTGSEGRNDQLAGSTNDLDLTGRNATPRGVETPAGTEGRNSEPAGRSNGTPAGRTGDTNNLDLRGRGITPSGLSPEEMARLFGTMLFTETTNNGEYNDTTTIDPESGETWAQKAQEIKEKDPTDHTQYKYTYGTLDLDNWVVKVNGGYLDIEGYKPAVDSTSTIDGDSITGSTAGTYNRRDNTHNRNTNIIIPNVADFENNHTGISGYSDTLTTRISSSVTENIINRLNPYSIVFSKTANKKTILKDNFSGGNYGAFAANNNSHSNLTNFDGTNLEVKKDAAGNGPANFDSMFINDGELSDKSLTTMKEWNVSGRNSFCGMFSGDSNLHDLTPLANWRVGYNSNNPTDSTSVSGDVNVAGMFNISSSKGVIADISKWYLKKVTTHVEGTSSSGMDAMFAVTPNQVIKINPDNMPSNSLGAWWYKGTIDGNSNINIFTTQPSGVTSNPFIIVTSDTEATTTLKNTLHNNRNYLGDAVNNIELDGSNIRNGTTNSLISSDDFSYDLSEENVSKYAQDKLKNVIEEANDSLHRNPTDPTTPLHTDETVVAVNLTEDANPIQLLNAKLKTVQFKADPFTAHKYIDSGTEKVKIQADDLYGYIKYPDGTTSSTLYNFNHKYDSTNSYRPLEINLVEDRNGYSAKITYTLKGSSTLISTTTIDLPVNIVSAKGSVVRHASYEVPATSYAEWAKAAIQNSGTLSTTTNHPQWTVKDTGYTWVNASGTPLNSSALERLFTTPTDGDKAHPDGLSGRSYKGAIDAYIKVSYVKVKSDGTVTTIPDGDQIVKVPLFITDQYDGTISAATPINGHVGEKVSDVSVAGKLTVKDSSNNEIAEATSATPGAHQWSFVGWVKKDPTSGVYEPVASTDGLTQTGLSATGTKTDIEYYAKIKINDGTRTYDVRSSNALPIQVIGGYEKVGTDGSYPTTTNNGTALTEDEAKTAIANNRELAQFAVGSTPVRYDWSTGDVSAAITAPDVVYDANDSAHNTTLRTANVIITYGDGTKQAVKVHYNVKSDADTFNGTITNAAGKEIDAHVNEALTDVSVPRGNLSVKDSSGNSLTENNSSTTTLNGWEFVGWATKSGNTYTDIDGGSTEALNVALGSNGVKDVNDKYYAKIELKDGSYVYSHDPIKVKVIGGYEKKNSDGSYPTTIDNGMDLTDDQAKDAIANNSDLAQFEPTYSWAAQADGSGTPDTTYSATSPVKTGYVIITYNDGVIQAVQVHYNINHNTLGVGGDGTHSIDSTNPRSEKYYVNGNDVYVHVGGTAPTAEQIVQIKDNAGNPVTSGYTIDGWDPLDMSTAGVQAQHLTIYYDDSSVTDTLNLTVHVIGATATDLTHQVYGGSTKPDAKNQISNANTLATYFGTPTYTWYKNSTATDPMTNADFNAEKTAGSSNNAWIKVDWGDGSSQVVGLKLNLTAAGTTASDADKNTPSAVAPGAHPVDPRNPRGGQYYVNGSDIYVHVNGNVPAVGQIVQVKNSDGNVVPSSDYRITGWTAPDTSTAGDHDEHLTITYGDNTTDSLNLKLHIVGAVLKNAIARDGLNHDVYDGSTSPVAKDQIYNTNDLATYFGRPTYTWYKDAAATEPMSNRDFETETTAGSSDNAWIKVDWGDGSSQIVGLKLNLTAAGTTPSTPSDADNNTPGTVVSGTHPVDPTNPRGGKCYVNGSDIYVHANGNVPAVGQIVQVKNSDGNIVPSSDYQITGWTAPSTGTAGDHDEHLTITYGDNTTDSLNLTVHVIGATATDLTHQVYGGSTKPDAKNQISNANTLATYFGTPTYTWYKNSTATDPMTNADFNAEKTAGSSNNAWIKVDWGDGSSQVVGLKLNLTAAGTTPSTPSDADNNTPGTVAPGTHPVDPSNPSGPQFTVGTGNDITIPVGGTVPAVDQVVQVKDSDGNVVPSSDYQITGWTAPDTSTAGDHDEHLTITYGDGTTKQMTVHIHVGSTTPSSDNTTPVVPSEPANTDNTTYVTGNSVVAPVEPTTTVETGNTGNTGNTESEPEVPETPVTHRQLVLYIGKSGRIVKRAYITVTEGETDLKVLTKLATSKKKMPKGYQATGKARKVAKHLDVWVTKKGQPGNKKAPRTKDVLYITKDGKIVKRTRITGDVNKLAKSKLPKGYKISGINRVNNHYNIWVKKSGK